MDRFKELLKNPEGKEQILSSLRRIQDEIGHQWEVKMLTDLKKRLEGEILDADANLQGEDLIMKRAELKYVDFVLDLPFKLTNVLLNKDDGDEYSDLMDEDSSDDPYDN